MDKLILQVIGIACFAVLVADASGLIQTAKYHWYKWRTGRASWHLHRWKPIDCPMCLSWWIGLIWFSISLHRIDAVLYGAICSVLAIYISKLIRI